MDYIGEKFRITRDAYIHGNVYKDQIFTVTEETEWEWDTAGYHQYKYWCVNRDTLEKHLADGTIVPLEPKSYKKGDRFKVIGIDKTTKKHSSSEVMRKVAREHGYVIFFRTRGKGSINARIEGGKEYDIWVWDLDDLEYVNQNVETPVETKLKDGLELVNGLGYYGIVKLEDGYWILYSDYSGISGSRDGRRPEWRYGHCLAHITTEPKLIFEMLKNKGFKPVSEQSQTLTDSELSNQMNIKERVTTAMNSITSKLKKLLRTEPEKSFIEQGVTTESGALTDAGREAFIEWSFNRDKKAFYDEVVKPIVDAETRK